MSPIATGEKAPTFELAGTDGKKYSLSGALGRGPLLAVFFKVSCPTCQFTLPFVERLYQQFLAAGAAGIQVWGISQDNVQNTRLFAQEFGLTFPMLIDEEPYEISQGYQLTHVPTLFVVGTGGQIEFSNDGFCKTDMLDIRRSLAAKYAVKPAELFHAGEQVPAYKPG
jgi:peroxiredoxin